MDFDIRQAKVTDHAGIWDILKPVFRAGDTYAVDPDISREDALAYWCDPRQQTFICGDGGEQVLGTYYLRRNQAGGGSHVCNCGYVTAVAAQGRGVARAMLAHSLVAAKAAGFRAMQYNFVVQTNDRAIRTWTRAGFDIVGRLPGAFHHPQAGYVDALVLYREL